MAARTPNRGALELLARARILRWLYHRAPGGGKRRPHHLHDLANEIAKMSAERDIEMKTPGGRDCRLPNP